MLTLCNPKSASFAVAIPALRRTFSSCTQSRYRNKGAKAVSLPSLNTATLGQCLPRDARYYGQYLEGLAYILIPILAYSKQLDQAKRDWSKATATTHTVIERLPSHSTGRLPLGRYLDVTVHAWGTVPTPRMEVLQGTRDIQAPPQGSAERVLGHGSCQELFHHKPGQGTALQQYAADGNSTLNPRMVTAR